MRFTFFHFDLHILQIKHLFITHVFPTLSNYGQKMRRKVSLIFCVRRLRVEYTSMFRNIFYVSCKYHVARITNHAQFFTRSENAHAVSMFSARICHVHCWRCWHVSFSRNSWQERFFFLVWKITKIRFTVRVSTKHSFWPRVLLFYFYIYLSCVVFHRSYCPRACQEFSLPAFQLVVIISRVLSRFSCTPPLHVVLLFFSMCHEYCSSLYLSLGDEVLCRVCFEFSAASTAPYYHGESSFWWASKQQRAGKSNFETCCSLDVAPRDA